MKYLLIFGFVLSIYSCKNKSGEATLPVADEDSLQSFFPVTDYLKGQVAQIKSNPINPLKIETRDGKSDSVYVKIESLDSLFEVFMQPVIDTINLMDKYKQSRFYDKTIDQYTLSYEAKDRSNLAAGLLNWDVYVSPKNNMVNRIYIVKELPNKSQLQLTWQSDKQCKILEVTNNKNSETENPDIKETNIIWKY